jgi:hypothetical protein
MFRIPVIPNQTVDNVKVEDQKNVDVESPERFKFLKLYLVYRVSE